MLEKSTDELEKILNFIDDEKSLGKYIEQTLSNEPLTMIQYIKDICLKKNISKTLLIQQSDIQRNYGYQILSEKRCPSRDNVIKICIGGQFSLEETNRTLTLGGYSKLYAKNARDSIIIFCINKCLNITKTNLLLDQYNQLPLGDVK